MATIKIQRTDEYINRIRNYQIFIDDQKAGTIANGETKEFTVGAGKHSIIAKIDWCCSPEVSLDLADNEQKNLKVGGFKNGYWIMPIALGIIALHFILKYMFDYEFTLLIAAPICLLLIYYVTAGRKKYLTLTEN